ncbi:MAG: NAD(P)-binding domain-containing protein, partial [Promicromonosporaceae bacterium]|nr:NAD(P)-binding domain-containing protein [Promicromonosporaceae bacterium]
MSSKSSVSGTREPSPIAAAIGSGTSGTIFAKILSDAGCPEVRLWAKDPEVAHDIHETHLNSRYLPNVELPANVKATANAVAALAGAELVVLALPTPDVRTVLESMAELVEPDAIIACLMADSESGNGKLPTDASEILQVPATRVVTVSGPVSAGDAATMQPVFVRSANPDAAHFVARLIGNTGRQAEVASNV